MLLDRLVCGVRDIRLQRCLLAKTDLTLQTALDEAHTAEMSTQSTEQIQKTQSPSLTWKSFTVHHDDIDPDEGTDTKDEQVNRLKEAKGKSWQTERQNPPSICRAVGGTTPKPPTSSRTWIAVAVEKGGI